MKRHVFFACGLLLMFSGAALAATILRATEDQLKQLEQRAAKASAASGREKETIQKIELAQAQLDSADAKASEKELIEKIALRRSELKKLEAQLERYNKGEAN